MTGGIIAGVILLSPVGVVLAIVGAVIGRYFDGRGESPADPANEGA